MEIVKATGQAAIAQGDVLFIPVGDIPAKASVISDKGRIVVAHSETGHHHVIDDVGVVHFKDPGDPLTCYLQIAEHADVKHLRGFDTHKTIRLPAGNWLVRRQREYSPEGWRRVED